MPEPLREIGEYKPYSKWTPEEKTDIAQSLLTVLSRTPRIHSSVDPGPLTIRQMQYLYHVYRNREELP